MLLWCGVSNTTTQHDNDYHDYDDDNNDNDYHDNNTDDNIADQENDADDKDDDDDDYKSKRTEKNLDDYMMMTTLVRSNSFTVIRMVGRNPLTLQIEKAKMILTQFQLQFKVKRMFAIAESTIALNYWSKDIRAFCPKIQPRTSVNVTRVSD